MSISVLDGGLRRGRAGTLFRVAILLILGLIAVDISRAEYFGFNTGKGADGTVMEVRWPYWAEHTYNALYYQSLSGADGASCFFYGGVVFADTNYPASGSPAFILWSFWPPNGTAAGQAVKPCYTASDMWAPPHIGEGASGKAEGAWPLLQKNQWYRFAFRVWQPADGTPHLAYVGQWLRDPATGNWYHLATMKIPFAATGINGLSGFLEDPARGNRMPRRADFRNVYYHMPGAEDQGWRPANQFKPSTRKPTEKGTAGLLENDTAAFFETCSGPDYTNYNVGPGSKSVTLTMTNQPPAAAFDPIVVEQASAAAADGQMIVQWKVPLTSSPQFAYRVEVFDNPACTGTPVVTFFEREPETREKLLSTPKLTSPGVRLTVTDIFNNAGKPIIVPVSKAKAVPAVTVAGAVPGLNYRYYQSSTSFTNPGRGTNWEKMPDLSTMQPLAQGAVDYPDLTPRQRRSGYAFDYTGYLKIPSSGIYDFILRTCSGGSLLIDGKKVIDSDTRHSPADASGWAALEAGTHAVELRYFFDTAPSSAGGFPETLSLSYEGPGVARTPVPVDAWVRTPESTEPQIALVSPADGAALSSCNIDLAPEVDARGATVKTVQFYNGDHYLGESAAVPYAFKAFLGAVEKQPLRARLVYNDHFTLDSPIRVVKVSVPSLAPWQLTAVGDRTRPAGADIQDGRYSLTGDGLNLLTQRMEGDCTLVAHLAEITSGKPAPDGATSAHAWSAGIIMRASTKAKPGSELGEGDTPYAAAFGNVGGSTYFQDVTMAGPGGHFASKDLGRASWFKLERSGNSFTTSISQDGTNWTLVNTKVIEKMPPVLYVGMFTYAPTSDNPSTHHATFDQVNLTGKAALTAAAP